jgi:hypothetical protein
MKNDVERALLEKLVENLDTLKADKALSPAEKAFVAEIEKIMK